MEVHDESLAESGYIQTDHELQMVIKETDRGMLIYCLPFFCSEV